MLEVVLETIVILRFVVSLSKLSVFEAPPPPRHPDVSRSAHLLVVAQHDPVRGHLDARL